MAELGVVVGWVASPIIKAMIDTARSYIESRLPWRSAVEGELYMLETVLTQILAVVSTAESLPATHNKDHLALLRQMKDAVYEAEDLLDEFGYLLLQSEVNSGYKAFLDIVGATVTTGSSSGVASAPQQRPTSAFPLENQFFGRKEERGRILQWLLESGDQSEILLSVVGDGGVGKTTLAQSIYNETKVADRFELRMWVCVSANFNELRLTREILSLACDDLGNDSASFNLNKLQEQLQKSVETKRFLLVLDDVWNDEGIEEWENRDRWMKLLAPLRFGGTGSKIIVTTRLEIVSRMLDAGDSIHLKGLEGDDYWLLFKRHAFRSACADDYPELQEVGWEIAKRLKGSPLGAKVVGGMLNADMNVEKWKNVLRSNVWNGIMPVLNLSYQNLPPHLQPCFAYSSIFPEDWRIEPDKLVYMWMAQGLLRPQEGRSMRMEDIGRIYFDDLLSRSFFQKLKDHNGNYYVMHDMIHELAQSVSKEECFRIESDNVREIPSTVRHLSINTDALLQLTSICDLKNLRTLVFFSYNHSIGSDVFKQLRSIRVLDLTECKMEQLPKAAGKLIHLRYLAFAETPKTAPSSIYRLYYLQVLDVSRSRLPTLYPKGMLFPEGMDKLINLRVLHVPGAFTSQIARIGKLTSLQRLAVFRTSKKKGRKIVELQNMNELRGSLRIMNLENVHSMQEAAEAKLNRKEYIKKLRLEWHYSEETRSNDDQILEGLQPHPNLEDLKIISCSGIRSPTWLETNWLSHLQSLTLSCCRSWISLPPLGRLPHLKFLEISRMYAVKKISFEFYANGSLKGFPLLEHLRFDRMPELVEWSQPEEYRAFPSLCDVQFKNCPKLTDEAFSSCLQTLIRLSSLEISCCHRLISLPSASVLHHLTTLKELDINCCENLASLGGIHALTSLEKLKLMDCPELLASVIIGEDNYDRGFLPASLASLEKYRAFPSPCDVQFKNCPKLTDEAFSSCLQTLIRLSSLQISCCHRLVSLPSASVLHHLTALKELDINRCENLASLGGIHALTSLEKLELMDCPKLLSSMIIGEDNYDRGFLPASLASLKIIRCGLTDASLSSCLQNLTSLSTLEIADCQITTLPSKQVMRHLTALKQLTFVSCSALTSLGGLSNLSSLKVLKFFHCHRLLESANTDGENGQVILPSALESLLLDSCGITDNSLSVCLQNLTSLSALRIHDCNGIVSLPPATVFCRLTMLAELEIFNCQELTSVVGLTALTRRRFVTISCCPKLADLSSISSQLGEYSE
ncbi:putative disease resistance protein RGA3 isoform X1 [Ananas comosus]|uniref:Disease resistance protein RGA3 isoform X1 n=1 Tax=Ananas comosus TaxID=4615 RepID=A0A6P5HN30_ANACO|nr:putative disease resistance protein RGA3 isoform X1 [Ananas comosus]